MSFAYESRKTGRVRNCFMSEDKERMTMEKAWDLPISEDQRGQNIQWTVGEDYRFSPQAVDPLFSREVLYRDSYLFLHSMQGGRERVYNNRQLKAFEHYLKTEHPQARLFLSLMTIPLYRHITDCLAEDRPVLADLYTAFQRRILHYYHRHAPKTEVEVLLLAHAERHFHQVPKVSPMTRRLLDDLEALTDLDTEDFISRMQALLKSNFHFNPSLKAETEFKKKEKAAKEEPPHKTSLEDIRDISTEELFEEMGITSAEFTGNIYLEERKYESGLEEFAALHIKKPSERDRRAFVERNYGPSYLSSQEEIQLLDRVCYGNHKDARLLLTKGFPPQAPQEGMSYRRRLMDHARARNEEYLRAHRPQIRRAIQGLVLSLRQSLTNEAEEGSLYEDHGILVSSRVWRNPILKEAAVFRKSSFDEPGQVIVDLLLDSSASQEKRQELVAAQAYILSKALSRLDIPLRISSFQSQQGYTILRRFKDYAEKTEAEKVLGYFADGANRDGFALRTIAAMRQKKSHARNMIIVLSDGKPFDEEMRINTRRFDTDHQYSGDLALQDTAGEIRRIRNENVSVFGIYTGEEKDLDQASLIYGSSFAYIKRVERFSEIVTRLLAAEIRGLEDR